MPKWPDVKPQPYHSEHRSPLIAVTAGGWRELADYGDLCNHGRGGWEREGGGELSDVIAWWGTRWIPVGEALPEMSDGEIESRRVLARSANGEVRTARLVAPYPGTGQAVLRRQAGMTTDEWERGMEAVGAGRLSDAQRLILDQLDREFCGWAPDDDTFDAALVEWMEIPE